MSARGSHAKASELAKALFGFKELFLVGFFLSIGLSGPLDWNSMVTRLDMDVSWARELAG